MTRASLRETIAYITKDGSEIRELIHPDRTGPSAMSLARAVVPPGAATRAHHHARSEEIYYFESGAGTMTLGDDTFPVRAGDAVRIPPGTVHSLANPANEPLVLLCCCAPPYSHDDTMLESRE